MHKPLMLQAAAGFAVVAVAAIKPAAAMIAASVAVVVAVAAVI